MADETLRCEVGMIVENPRMPAWGPGRVLNVQGSKVWVYFRDVRGDARESVKQLDTKFVQLVKAAVQSDPILDNLPPYADGKFQRPVRRRVTLDEGIEKFHAHYPLYFEDPKYLGDMHEGERVYKWAAHELFERELGGGKLRELLTRGELSEARRRALAVEGRMNVLSQFETAAFRDAMKDDAAAKNYLEALDLVLASGQIEQSSFEQYLEVVTSLPSKEGKTSPAKWTVATLLPFLAKPSTFMFLKPEVTQACAASLMYDLRYSTQLNWTTYDRLLDMSEYLLDALRQYGARDFIDVQSFIWLIGAAWKD